MRIMMSMEGPSGPSGMTPQEFIAKWGPGGPSYGLNERQRAQPHFIDLCTVLNWWPTYEGARRD